MRLIKDHKEWAKRTNLVRAILRKIVVFLKGWIPNRFKHKIKNVLLYYYVVIGKLNPIPVQKFCFFYKPEVPDFGKEFTYLKLGKKEEIANPNRYSVIFEADLPDNLSKYNKHLLDYSGLYALYRNNLVKKDYMLLIHYDTQILHKKWIEIITGCLRKNNVVFSTWPIGVATNEVGKWLYPRIDDVFLISHKHTFFSYLETKNITILPNTSQFSCSRDTFNSLMKYLLPLYEYTLKCKDISFLYAHLLERGWGLFFALEKYKTVAVIKDSHSQAENYRTKAHEQTKGIPI